MTCWGVACQRDIRYWWSGHPVPEKRYWRLNFSPKVRAGAKPVPPVIAAFEKSPSQLLSSKLDALVKAQQVGVIDTCSLDLSIDQTLHDLIKMITSMKAKRVVIGSLSGFELALAPEF